VKHLYSKAEADWFLIFVTKGKNIHGQQVPKTGGNKCHAAARGDLFHSLLSPVSPLWLKALHSRTKI